MLRDINFGALPRFDSDPLMDTPKDSEPEFFFGPVPPPFSLMLLNELAVLVSYEMLTLVANKLQPGPFGCAAA